MIDLHCHILPGVDDGALDLRDSVGMARQAAADGIGSICATPHIRHDHDVRIEELADRVAEVNRRCRGRGIPVTVLRGGRGRRDRGRRARSDDELARVALGGGRWILLEPCAGPLGERLLERVRRWPSTASGP